MALSDREKQIVVKLSKAGVNSNVIAKAFGIKTMSVAGILAWNTIRNK